MAPRKQPSVLEQIQRVTNAQQALQRGNRLEAANLFRIAALGNTISSTTEPAWLGLASLVVSNSERRYCLDRALKANPTNEQLRQMVQALEDVPAKAPLILYVSGDTNKWSDAERASVGAASSQVAQKSTVATPTMSATSAPVMRSFEPVSAVALMPERQTAQNNKGVMMVGIMLFVILAGFIYFNSPSRPTVSQPIAKPVIYATDRPVYQSIPVVAPVSGGGTGGSVCNDGSVSASRGRGACSHHGGVSH